MSEQLTPFYEDVQAIYDYDQLTEFLSLFLDPTMLYTCAYFERPEMSLYEAQVAKLDLIFGKLDLKPGMTVLDVGCGWGTAVHRVLEKYDCNVVGLTLSKNQREYCIQKLEREYQGPRSWDIRLEGWEQYSGKVDRIFSIGAFEHFRQERHAAFFEMCQRTLTPGGKMVLHCITWPDPDEFFAGGREVTHEAVLFGKFIRKEIFPGGMLEQPGKIIKHAEKAGFTCTRRHSLQPHYARTLKCWGDSLEENKDKAIAMTSQVVYDRYMKYLRGCERYFASGHIDLNQFTLVPR